MKPPYFCKNQNLVIVIDGQSIYQRNLHINDHSELDIETSSKRHVFNTKLCITKYLQLDTNNVDAFRYDQWKGHILQSASHTSHDATPTPLSIALKKQGLHYHNPKQRQDLIPVSSEITIYIHMFHLYGSRRFIELFVALVLVLFVLGHLLAL